MRAKMRYIIIGLLVFVIPAMLSVPGCAGMGQSDGAVQLESAPPLAGDASQLAALLPPLPDDSLAPRAASAETQQTQNGDEAVSQSPGAVANGSVLQLVSSEAEPLQWGIYVFALGGKFPLRFSIDAGVNAGQYWVAVGNYSTGSWEINGPYVTTGAEVQTLPPADYTSPGDNASVAVIAARMDGMDADVDLNGVTLTVGDEAPPTYSISGTILEDGTETPLEGVSVQLNPGDKLEMTDASGNYEFGGLEPGDYTIAPTFAGYIMSPPTIDVTVVDADVTGQDFTGTLNLILSGQVETAGSDPIDAADVYLVAVNPDGSINAAGFRSTTTDVAGNYEFETMEPGDYRLIPQKDGYVFTPNIVEFSFSGTEARDFTGEAVSLPATVTYDDQMLPWLFEPVCMNCHDSAKTDAARNFAPLTVNFDTYDGTTELLKTHGNTRVQADTMPPATLHFKTTQFEKDLFQKWLDGGFQEN